jgi:hypothetical protein
MVIDVSGKAMLLSVTVSVATRTGPVFGATEKAIVPLPAPETPCVIVTNEALLTAPHVHVLDVAIATDADPPAAANEVAVLPVITVQPFDPLGPEGLSSPHAVANSSRTASDVSLIRTSHLCRL